MKLNKYQGLVCVEGGVLMIAYATTMYINFLFLKNKMGMGYLDKMDSYLSVSSCSRAAVNISLDMRAIV